MIVLKFGGTSVADASRLSAVCEIVRARLAARPVVVVSALAGVTDLLVRATERARAGDRDGLEPILSDLERRHRWAVAGGVESAAARHDLTLKVDSIFEELRQLLRSVRILRDPSLRAADALLAHGEMLSAAILAATLRERGIRAEGIDPRSVVITDGKHGAADADAAATETRARQVLLPRIEAGTVPVVGGFVGATLDGLTTTLGRGGSDTSASVLGAALRAEEVQIWTDVDGLMSADPRIVPEARPLERISFAEAAELAYYGAKVLHPGSLAPAVCFGVPVRILNTFRPGAAGTQIVDDAAAGTGLASIASRGGVTIVRVVSRRMCSDPGLLLRALTWLAQHDIAPDMVIASEVGSAIVVPSGPDLGALRASLSEEALVTIDADRAVLCLVGAGLARDGALRGRVLETLAALAPEGVALGGSGTSATAVLPEAHLDDAVRTVHARFFASGAIA